MRNGRSFVLSVCRCVGLSLILYCLQWVYRTCTYYFSNKGHKKGGQQSKPGQGKFHRKPQFNPQGKKAAKRPSDTASVASSGTPKTRDPVAKKQKS